MNHLSIIKLFGVSLAAVSLFSCSEVSFTQLKTAKLKGTNAFGEGTGKLPGGSYLENLNLGGEITEQLYPPAEFVETLNVELERICSDSKSERKRSRIDFEELMERGKLDQAMMNQVQAESLSNVQLAPSVALLIKNSRGQIVCLDQEKDYKEDLINLASVDIPIKCQLMSNQRYAAHFVDTRYIDSHESLGSIQIVVDSSGKVELAKSRMRILYATNPKSGDFAALNTGESFELCDKHQSPLVIQLSDKAIELSSITEGIEFDILGAKNGYQKSQISWPMNDAMAFIALPDVSGSVHSIDQLFGNNTLGPDGHFAKDGYAALAKYDDDGNGKIDEKDAIFKHLRLFIDDNRDGQSQHGELASLRSQGIYSIDLDFDGNYEEQDLFGNKILFKSVAETDVGMMLVFDIWFRVAPY